MFNNNNELEEVIKAYNYVFGYVTTYYEMFFKKQDRELPWAMVANIIYNNTGNYYAGVGMSHLTKTSKEVYDSFMEEHKEGFKAWSDFVESRR